MCTTLVLLVQAMGFGAVVVSKIHEVGSQEGGWSTDANLKEHMMGEPFAGIGIDILGPYNVTVDGNKYILVVLDYFTNWERSIP